MATTHKLHRALADVRDHWITAAAYDVYCAREADHLLKRDRWVSNIVLTATTISSLGIFTTFVADRPPGAQARTGGEIASHRLWTHQRPHL